MAVYQAMIPLPNIGLTVNMSPPLAVEIKLNLRSRDQSIIHVSTKILAISPAPPPQNDSLPDAVNGQFKTNCDLIFFITALKSLNTTGPKRSFVSKPNRSRPAPLSVFVHNVLKNVFG